MKRLSLFILGLVLLASATSAKAFCPICTVAVAGGVGLSRWLGIDDTITGLWVGGFLLSSVMWANSWLQRKGVKIFGYKVITFVAFYGLTAIPLYKYEIIGHPQNIFWGVDKLVLGILLGSAGFYLGARAYDMIKKKRGRSHFHFQKIAMSLFPLLALSIAFYFITMHK